MSGHAWTVKNKDQVKEFSKWVEEQQEAGKEYTYSIKEMTRSEIQNAALHSMFRRLSTSLNDAGYDMKHEQLVKKDLPWTEQNIKEVLFKPMIKQLYNVDSTTKLTKEQLSDAVEALFKGIAMRTGVTVPFTTNDRDSL
mgnify:CR=1 FL=1